MINWSHNKHLEFGIFAQIVLLLSKLLLACYQSWLKHVCASYATHFSIWRLLIYKTAGLTQCNQTISIFCLPRILINAVFQALVCCGFAQNKTGTLGLIQWSSIKNRTFLVLFLFFNLRQTRNIPTFSGFHLLSDNNKFNLAT